MTFADWWQRFQRRDRTALARLISLAARGQHLTELKAALAGLPRSRATRVIAFTGAGGVGKSTLVGKMLDAFRTTGHAVAVLACDPESPLTGGALLGDRLRMPTRHDDDEAFIRSLATPSGHEAVPDHLDLIIELLTAFGFDFILLETVGAGQGDTAVRQLADVLVVLVQPEAGDDIQWEKAGLLEVADVVVVHKADLPGADRTEAQVKSLLNLPGCRDVPVVRASSNRSEGLDQLRELLLTLPSRRGEERRSAASLIRAAQDRLADHWQGRPTELAEVVRRWQQGEWTTDQTASRLLDLR